ncbi:MAG: YraN family protein [Thermoleophilaceae bacterium]
MSEDPRRRRGQLGERLARRHLSARGYELLDANFRTRFGELDIVARDRGCLVFCEVKTRLCRGPPGPFGPLTGVDGRKRRQVRRLARQWLAERGGRVGRHAPELRFDAIGVELDADGRLRALEHLEGAF